MIRVGIETDDMDKVKKGYELMSGQKVVRQKSTMRAKEEQVYSGSSEEEDGGVVRSNFRLGQRSYDEDGNEKRLAKKVPVQINPRNFFEDKGDKGDVVQKPTRANNKKKAVSSVYVTVTCKECQDSFRVNKSILPVSVDANENKKKRPYICDDCISSRR